MTLSSHEIERYARQTIVPQLGLDSQVRLKNSTVLVIGAGGLGSPVLLYLAAAGVGRIIITDPDTVDLSNLQRQVIYNEDEIGRSKSVVSGSKLKALNRDIEIVPHVVRLNASNIRTFIEQVDLVIDGSDNFETRYLVNDACVLYDRTLVFGAVNQFEGQVAVFNHKLDHTKRSAHYRDLFPVMPERGSVLNCAETGVLGPVAGLVGSIMATEAIKVLTGVGEPLVGRLLQIDSMTMDFRTIRFPVESASPVPELKDDVPFCVVENRLISWNALKAGEHFLVDVRTPEEKKTFDAGGILIPLKDLPQRLEELPIDTPVVFYCKTGVRSDEAVRILAGRSDRKDVYSIEGGLFSLDSYQG